MDFDVVMTTVATHLVVLQFGIMIGVAIMASKKRGRV